jgi:uncharacterized protein DUF4258
VLIARLLFNDVAQEKLGRRCIEPEEIRQLRRNGPVIRRNPRPRTRGSKLMVGETDGGRVLVVVIEPGASNRAVWEVRTAWVASRHERKAYHRSRRS